MDKIEKIRQEIERRRDICNGVFERDSDTYYQGKAVAYDEALSFIDSLPDEPVSNDLEEAAKTFCNTLEGKEAWSYGPSHYDGDDVNNAFIAGAEWMAKQKEQKSAKWSEEDEILRVRTINRLETLNFHGISGKEIRESIDWLKSLPERFNPQPNIEICPHSIKSKSYKEKPAECIEDSIEYKEGFKTGRETGLRDGEKYVLDNLESYGLCKSAEWSKEDERNKDRAIFYTCYYQRTNGTTDGSKECIDWLKSLRPSWKPSENQMSMLLAVVNDPNNAGSASCHLSLKSLYNDLKKL